MRLEKIYADKIDPVYRVLTSNIDTDYVLVTPYWKKMTKEEYEVFEAEKRAQGIEVHEIYMEC